MDNPQLIALDDVVLRDDLDPRLGERDDDLIAQYADIFDALPPIEINQHNELIDGWHRVRAAERAKRTDIAYVVVETDGDDDLGDRMWAANLKHGVQYSRAQRQIHGVKLHKRKLTAQEIAERVGVGINTVYRWTKELRESEKQERDQAALELAGEGKTQQEIADQLSIPRQTISRILAQNPQMIKMGSTAELPENTSCEPESEAMLADEPEPDQVEIDDSESVLEKGEALAEAEAANPDPEPDEGETPADEQPDISQPEPEPADEEPTTPDVEPDLPPPEPIPDDILNTARTVMGTFAESRPNDYVARLEASPSEWMTITDDSLSNEIERELLTSAAAMCLWQEWMIWYQGEQGNAFTEAFGEIGPVFVRGRSGQWRIVSKLRSILRRLRT